MRLCGRSPAAAAADLLPSGDRALCVATRLATGGSVRTRRRRRRRRRRFPGCYISGLFVTAYASTRVGMPRFLRFFDAGRAKWLNGNNVGIWLADFP